MIDAEQLVLVDSVRPPALLDYGIDLRCCGVVEMMESLPRACADMVLADPPWAYSQKFGESSAEDHYPGLSTALIAEHMRIASVLAPRLALWIPGPLLGEWMALDCGWGRPKTVGTWVKSGIGKDGFPNKNPDSGHYGQGYHWAGCAEFVLIYTRGKAYNDRAVKFRNSWVERPNAHSRKPVGYQALMAKRWTRPGSLTIGMYSGLASDAEAILTAGGDRRFIGTEISPKRYEQALALLAQFRRE